MANGDEHYVPWKHFREHEQKSEIGFRDLAVVKSDIQHLNRWRGSVEETLKDLTEQQERHHAENQRAITGLGTSIAKKWGIAVGVILTVQTAVIILIAYLRG